MHSERQLNVLAGGVHGVICALNALACFYNALNGHKGRAVIHAAVALYEAHAVSLHMKHQEGS